MLLGLVTSAGVVGNIGNVDTADRRRGASTTSSSSNVALAFVSAIAGVVYLVMIRQLAARHMQATGE